MTGIAAGRLRHRITIQRPISSQDLETGQVTTNWIAVAKNVAAAVEPVSVREFVAAQAMQSQVTARIVIRYRPGLTAQMRILHGAKIYNPAGFLSDTDSGLEYLTIPVTEGTNAG